MTLLLRLIQVFSELYKWHYTEIAGDDDDDNDNYDDSGGIGYSNSDCDKVGGTFVVAFMKLF